MGIEERRFGQHRRSRTSKDQKLCRDVKLQVIQVRLSTQDITKSINPTFLKTPGEGWRLFASRIGLFSEGLKEVIPVVVGWA